MGFLYMWVGPMVIFVSLRCSARQQRHNKHLLLQAALHLSAFGAVRGRSRNAGRYTAPTCVLRPAHVTSKHR